MATVSRFAFGFAAGAAVRAGVPAAGAGLLGPADGGQDTAAWLFSSNFTGVPTGRASIAMTMAGLDSDMLIHYRLRGVQPDGAIVWSSPASFRTLGGGDGRVGTFFITGTTATTAKLSAQLAAPFQPGATVELLAGPVDRGSDENAWPLRAQATVVSGDQREFVLTGLRPGTLFFGRALITTPAGSATVSSAYITFGTESLLLSLQSKLKISEIMYHPPPPFPQEMAAGFEDDDFEFIELQNTGADPMDLSGLWFEGIDFDFPATGAPVIPAGGFAVIARNPHAFAMRYGAHVPLAGWTLHPFRSSGLSNYRETLRILSGNAQVLTVDYRDSADSADGGGFSIEWLPGSTAGGWRNYRLSRLSGGTPGRAGIAPPSQSFAAWQILHFTPAEMNDPLITGSAADPDQDGLSNYTEYACALNPGVRDSRELLTIRDGGRLPDSDRHRVLLTFPASAIASEPLFTLQGMDKSLSAWRNDAVNITSRGAYLPATYTDPFSFSYGDSSLSPVLYWSSALCTMHSAVLSADGKQFLYTVSMEPGNFSGTVIADQPSLTSRRFRLVISRN